MSLPHPSAAEELVLQGWQDVEKQVRKSRKASQEPDSREKKIKDKCVQLNIAPKVSAF